MTATAQTAEEAFDDGALVCPHCEDGTIWYSRYGGNDPDVWRGGECSTCDGAGNRLCDEPGCGDVAVAVWDLEVFCEAHAPADDDGEG